MTASNWIVTPDKFLSPEQVAVLRASNERHRQDAVASRDRLGVRNAVLVELLLGTGLRVSELCALTVGDVYLGEGRADVLVRRGKGGKARMVGISERMVEYLRAFLGWKEGVAESLDHQAPIFRSERGRHLTRSAVHRIWKSALARASLPTSWGVHATRHSYAVEVYRQTRDLRLTQRLLGHSSPVVTSVYANLLDEDIRRGVERVWTA